MWTLIRSILSMCTASSCNNDDNYLNLCKLGTLGVAIIWRNLLTKFVFDISNIQYFIYIVALYGLLLMSLYLLKVLLHFNDFLLDLNAPPKLAGLGSLSMSISLFGSLLTMEQLKIDVNVVIAVVLFGAFIQLLSMCRFFRLCWLESSYPEPYWNAAVLSSVFPAITLPNLDRTDYEFVLRIRQAYHILAWCIFIWIIPVMIYRTVIFHRQFINPSATKANSTSITATDKSPTIPPAVSMTVVVAPNPSVCLLQAGTSIMCSAWHRTPLFISIDSRNGRIVSHTTFAISTVGMMLIAVVNMYDAVALCMIILSIVADASCIVFTIYHHHYHTHNFTAA